MQHDLKGIAKRLWRSTMVLWHIFALLLAVLLVVSVSQTKAGRTAFQLIPSTTTLYDRESGDPVEFEDYEVERALRSKKYRFPDDAWVTMEHRDGGTREILGKDVLWGFDSKYSVYTAYQAGVDELSMRYPLAMDHPKWQLDHPYRSAIVLFAVLVLPVWVFEAWLRYVFGRAGEAKSPEPSSK